MAGKFTVEQIVEAIAETRGLVTLAARRLGCSPTTIRNYADRHPEVAAALVEARDHVTDVAESALFRAIRKGEAWAVCFYLKTQGKARGYVERQEITGKDGGPVEHSVDDARDRLSSAVERLAARREAGGVRVAH